MLVWRTMILELGVSSKNIDRIIYKEEIKDFLG